MANKCHFRKKNGIRCGGNAQPANGLCVFHDPAKASEGHRAQRAGGIARSRMAMVLPVETPVRAPYLSSGSPSDDPLPQ